MAKKIIILIVLGFFTVTFTLSCGPNYRRQKGAGIGAAVGAIGGQLIGHSTSSTLIGAAVGTLFGYIVADAIDEHEKAVADAYRTGNTQSYSYKGGEVEVIPHTDSSAGCKTTTHIYKGKKLVQTVIDDHCNGRTVIHKYQ
jgi:hypothetical protein